jgi:flagellar motor switch protein FliG
MVAIGPQKARPLLDHLVQHDVERLAAEVANLGRLDPQARNAVLREVVEGLRDGSVKVQSLLDSLAPALPAAEPFAALEAADVAQAVQILKGEHPQTVALVLAHRTPKWGAQILAALDADTVAEISLRLATLGRPHPALVAQVDRLLSSRVVIDRKEEMAEKVTEGPRELASILNLAPKALEEAVLGELAERDLSLAHQVKALMFVFEDIGTLDDRTIQKVLQNVQAATLAMALKGASEDLRQGILRNLSERARNGILEEMDLIGPARRSQVEEARALVVAQVRALEEQGEIQIARTDDGDLVA